jgi:nucleoside-diphosphate-sugar epimerase
VGDLRDAASLSEAVRGAELIFHVAGVVAAKDRQGFFEANAEGTRNLIETVRAHNPNLKRFVYVSSLAAAGPSKPDRENQEEDPCLPVSDYGASKRAGEEIVLSAAKEFPVAIVRPPAVYGPRDKGVYTFFQAVNTGVLPLLGFSDPGPRKYSFVHVEDLVQCLVLVGTEAQVQSGDIFNASGDGVFSWEEAMQLIARGMGKKTLRVRLPIALLRCAAGACSAYTKLSGNVLPFSLDKVKEIEAPSWSCSNAKAKKVLGFKPYWDLPKGLAATAAWYRENGLL